MVWDFLKFPKDLREETAQPGQAPVDGAPPPVGDPAALPPVAAPSFAPSAREGTVARDTALPRETYVTRDVPPPRVIPTAPAPRAATPAPVAAPTEVHLLKTFDARALGVARDAVRSNIEEFEAALQSLTRMPNQFRLMMTPIENAVGMMGLLRNRLEVCEEALAYEQQRNSRQENEQAALAEEVQRLITALKHEEATNASLRQRNLGLETGHSRVQQELNDLQARVARFEPQIRELTLVRDKLKTELSAVQKAKDQADETIADLRSELNGALEEVADRNNLLTSLQLANARLRERLDESGKAIGELEAATGQLQDKYETLLSEATRERNATITLRAENKQLRMEADEYRAQAEHEIDAARARYEFLEKALIEARARSAEESRQLGQVRRERAERDRELGRLKLALEAAQRETTELRAQLGAANESSIVTSLSLSGEIEARQKLELEIDMLRSENATLQLKQRAASEMARAGEITQSEVVQRLQARIAQLSAENDELRAGAPVRIEAPAAVLVASPPPAAEAAAGGEG